VRALLVSIALVIALVWAKVNYDDFIEGKG
jgi:hypothetical protein